MTKRFERLLDPFGQWTIWDKETDAPVSYDGRFLPALRSREAEILTALLNAMDHQPRMGDQDNQLRSLAISLM